MSDNDRDIDQPPSSTPFVAAAATILAATMSDASNSPTRSKSTHLDGKKSVGGNGNNENSDDDDENHGTPGSSVSSSSDEGTGPSEYELRRLANMKRNEHRLKQLGLDGTWKDQMKKRAGGGTTNNKRKKQSIPEPSRRSNRDKKVHDYKRLSNGY